MNKNFKEVMSELQKLKAIFSKKAINFEQVTLLDGLTVIEFEKLEVGFPVYVVTEQGMIPAPEGTHALGGDYEGVTITVDAEGYIMEVVDERANATDTPTSQTNEEMSKIIENVVNAKLESFNKHMTEVVEMMSAIAKANANLNEQIATLKSDFEGFKALPANETKESEKFARVGNLTAKQQFIKTYKNL